MKCVGFTNQTHEAKRGPLTPRCPPSALGGTPQVFWGPLPSFKSLVPSAFFCLFIFVCVRDAVSQPLSLCVIASGAPGQQQQQSQPITISANPDLTTPSKTDRLCKKAKPTNGKTQPHTYDIPYACKEFTEIEQQYSNWQDALR